MFKINTYFLNADVYKDQRVFSEKSLKIFI